MKAEIIAVGDELLIGQITDTNTPWIARELNKSGINVGQVTTVSDSIEHIVSAVSDSWNRSDIVIMTGGLGPTSDDKTKESLCVFFESGLVLNARVLEHIQALFKKRSIEMPESNNAQAMVPEKCRPVFNTLGTAPGMWFEENGKVLVSMPGVPFEMKKMMESEVIPSLKEKFTLPHIYHKTLVTINIPESLLSQKLRDVEKNLPQHIKLAYLPNLNIVRLRFSSTGGDELQLKNDIEQQVQKVKEIIGDSIVAEDDLPLQEIIGKLLAKSGKTLSTAESCTGGYIAHLVTQIPGSSSYFKGSVVAYDYDIKTSQLQVSTDALNKFGAVSEEVVTLMAENVRKNLGSDFSVATSGIAGPGGGTTEKPVGTAWIAVASETETIAKKFLFHGDRLQVIERTANNAMEMLRKILD